jgi:hypothetical protein
VEWSDGKSDEMEELFESCRNAGRNVIRITAIA